jgi:hypothetical protein
LPVPQITLLRMVTSLAFTSTMPWWKRPSTTVPSAVIVHLPATPDDGRASSFSPATSGPVVASPGKPGRTVVPSAVAASLRHAAGTVTRPPGGGGATGPGAAVVGVVGGPAVVGVAVVGVAVVGGAVVGVPVPRSGTRSPFQYDPVIVVWSLVAKGRSQPVTSTRVAA